MWGFRRVFRADSCRSIFKLKYLFAFFGLRLAIRHQHPPLVCTAPANAPGTSRNTLLRVPHLAWCLFLFRPDSTPAGKPPIHVTKTGPDLSGLFCSCRVTGSTHACGLSELFLYGVLRSKPFAAFVPLWRGTAYVDRRWRLRRFIMNRQHYISRVSR